MNNTTVRKHKVEIADYEYQRDIAIRLLFANLTELEKNIIEEIINGSVKCSIKQIAATLEADPLEISPFLTQLEKLDLYKIQGDQLLVNKEMRKFFADEFERFSPSFEPDMLYLQSLLNRVPIHILPQWFAISRSTDNIFASIIERYFHTPRLYRKHLDEMAIENPLLYRIYLSILQSDELCVSAKELMAQHKLTHEQFEKLMLEFEYNLCGCLCYKKEDGSWKEYATLYHEWKLYKSFKKEHAPPTQNPEAVERMHASDFFFVEEMTKLLQSINEKVAPQKNNPLTNELLKIANDLHLLDNPQNWVRKTKQEQASMMYQLLLNQARTGAGTFIEKELREVEKALKFISQKGWILFDDFIKSFTGSLRNHPPIELHRKGKKWRYKLPEYSNEEKSLVYQIITDFLWKACIVIKGSIKGKPCFAITPFGRMSLGE